jgi:hypothetical protein
MKTFIMIILLDSYFGIQYTFFHPEIKNNTMLVNGVGTNITFTDLYNSYAYTEFCSLGAVEFRKTNKTNYLFFLTANHCLNNTIVDYWTVIYKKKLHQGCQVVSSNFTRDYGEILDTAVVACITYLGKQEVSLVTPRLIKNNHQNKEITYVSLFRHYMEKENFIWPDNINCHVNDVNLCELAFFSYRKKLSNKLVEVSGTINQINYDELYFYISSNSSSWPGASGSLAAFENDNYFDAIEFANTVNSTLYISTSSYDFREFWNETKIKINEFMKLKKDDERLALKQEL